MRQFLVVGHDVPTEPSFSLDDIAGGAGRLDVLCRCVNSAFFLSHDLREDVQVHLVLSDEYTVSFDGADLRRLNPDERSTAALIRGALEEREEAIGHQPVETSPGVSLYRMGFSATFDRVARDATVVQLHEDGEPLVDVDELHSNSSASQNATRSGDAEPPEDPLFVLSDHNDFAAEEADRLAEEADRRVRVGPKRLHADHTITVAHNFLDTEGYERY